MVISQVWYRVGAADEPTNLGGMSHLFEHMMFKGTKTCPQQILNALSPNLAVVIMPLPAMTTPHIMKFPCQSLSARPESRSDDPFTAKRQ